MELKEDDLIREAREWVAECSWKEDPEEIEEYSDAEIKRGVNRHYEGGWCQFVFDCTG